MSFTRSVLVLAGLASLALVPAASAQVTKCRGNQYFAVNPTAFPGIKNERAVNLPRLTSDYAPRCLVVESIAGGVQYFWSHHQRLPRSLAVHGARWNAGTWKLSYTTRHVTGQPAIIYKHMVARHGKQAVTMDLTS